MTTGPAEEWRLPSSAEMLRRRPFKRLAEPLQEREFLYRYYDEFLSRLVGWSLNVVPLRELEDAPPDRPAVALRHDVDDRLESALVFGELEQRHGVRSTYYVLHTAAYYERRSELLPALRLLQDMGHEIGWHNDLLTAQLARGVDPREYLARELEWLRSAGIDIVGVAAHGSYLGHRYGFDNRYFFEEFDAPLPGFPNTQTVQMGGSAVRVAKGTLAEFGLQYEANYVPHDSFYSDARFDAAGRRWHPDRLDLDALRTNERVIALVHSCHWDSSLPAKFKRTVGRLVARAARR